MAMTPGPKRLLPALMPASAIPLAYYAFAHLTFGLALIALLLNPGVPGTSFYHPRMVALVHVLTLAWMSGSILGSLYIVAPLALRIPLPAGRADWLAFVLFASGTSGMIAHFWSGWYDGVAWSAFAGVAAIGWVGWRTCRGLGRSPAPAGVSLHVALAFINILTAALLGILVALDRSRGFLGLSPLAVTFAHAHLAAVGWGLMLVVGLSYRLIPMMLPAAMPTGRGLAASAILLELGLVAVVTGLLVAPALVAPGGVVITSACGV